MSSKYLENWKYFLLHWPDQSEVFEIRAGSLCLTVDLQNHFRFEAFVGGIFFDAINEQVCELVHNAENDLHPEVNKIVFTVQEQVRY